LRKTQFLTIFHYEFLLNILQRPRGEKMRRKRTEQLMKKLYKKLNLLIKVKAEIRDIDKFDYATQDIYAILRKYGYEKA
jgi:hypothetical protein